MEDDELRWRGGGVEFAGEFGDGCCVLGGGVVLWIFLLVRVRGVVVEIEERVVLDWRVDGVLEGEVIESFDVKRSRGERGWC